MAEPNQQSSGTLLFQAFTNVKRQGSRFKPDCGIRPSEFFLLHTIFQSCEQPEHAEGIRVSDISRITHHSMPAVSQNLRTLVEMGLVQRSYIRRDRRSVLICPTDEGKALIERVGTSFSQLLEEVTHRLGEEDTQRLILLLNRLSAVLEEMLPQPSERKE